MLLAYYPANPIGSDGYHNATCVREWSTKIILETIEPCLRDKLY